MGTSILVEGIFDAIALIESGFHAISLLGKVLTQEKYELIKSAKEIILSLDNNEPGIKATNSIEEFLRNNGFNSIKYIFAPEDKDWSKYYSENNRNTIRKYIKNNINEFNLSSKISIILNYT